MVSEVRDGVVVHGQCHGVADMGDDVEDLWADTARPSSPSKNSPNKNQRKVLNIRLPGGFKMKVLNDVAHPSIELTPENLNWVVEQVEQEEAEEQ